MGEGCQYDYPDPLLGELNMPVKLPGALLRSDDYLELSEKQAFNLQARFNYIDEIVNDITQWINSESNSEMLDDFLDTLELDVNVNLSIDSGNDNESIWLIHSSWGDGIEERPSQDKLPTDVLTSLDADLPRLSADDAEINAWLKNQSNTLRRALKALSAASDFSEVLSSILAVDILMAKLLAGIYKLRIRKNKWQ